MYRFLSPLLLLFATLLLGYLTFSSYQSATDYNNYTQKISTNQNTSKTLQKGLNRLLEELSIGIYDRYSKNEKELEALNQKAKKLYQKSILYLYYFFLSLILFGILFLFLDREYFTIFIGLGALIALFGAIFSPLLMMTVYKSFPLIGEVTLSYESKSIYSTISKLFSQSNYLLGILVLLFSLVIPFFKALLITTYGFLKESGIGKKGVKLIEKIGKWSMADVFIVAVLVVFFSTKQDIHTALKIQVGLYFFVAYVLLSMLGSSMLTKEESL